MCRIYTFLREATDFAPLFNTSDFVVISFYVEPFCLNVEESIKSVCLARPLFISIYPIVKYIFVQLWNFIFNSIFYS